VSIAGTILVAIGYAIRFFAQNVETLYPTIGIIGGMITTDIFWKKCLLGNGFSFVYLPLIVIVPQYFSKRRALAVGLSVCGAGIGILTF